MSELIRAVPFATPTDIDAALPRVVEHLRAQRIIAYPTETVYGFGSSIMHEAITRVARIKRAPPDRSFIALIAGLEMLAGLNVTLAGPAAALAARYWPGPLTLLLENAHRVRTGVRWTSHSAAQRIIRAFGAPITSTSANRSGLPPVTTAAEIVQEWEREMREGILLVLDGGTLASGLPSTIVDCTAEPPRVVRSGAIRIEDMRTIVPDIV